MQELGSYARARSQPRACEQEHRVEKIPSIYSILTYEASTSFVKLRLLGYAILSEETKYSDSDTSLMFQKI